MTNCHFVKFLYRNRNENFGYFDIFRTFSSYFLRWDQWFCGIPLPFRFELGPNGLSIFCNGDNGTGCDAWCVSRLDSFLRFRKTDSSFDHFLHRHPDPPKVWIFRLNFALCVIMWHPYFFSRHQVALES